MTEVTVAASVLELAFATVPATVAAALWRYRSRPAALPVFIMTLTAAVYSASAGIATLLGVPILTEFLYYLRWPLGATIAAGAFYTGVEYTDRTEFQHPLVVIGLIGFVIIDAAVILSNPIHQAVFSELVLSPDGRVVTAQTGPLVIVHLLFSIGLAVAGVELLVVRYLRDRLYRWQTGALIIGISLGIVFFVLESAVVIHPAFNLATVGLAAGSLALLWAIIRVEFLQTVPIARETLMGSMDDIVIALDAENRVIDMNRAATELVDGTYDIGNHVEKTFDNFPEFATRLAESTAPCQRTDSDRDVTHGGGRDSSETDLSLTRDGETRYYDLNVSAIEYATGYRAGPAEDSTVGRLFVVRDVTPSRRREEELDLIKQVFARVLRHNLRNDLNIIRGEADQLDCDGEDCESVEAIIERADHMIDLSEKARHLERIIERPDSSLQFRLRSVVETAIEDATVEYPEASVRVDVGDLPRVRAHGALPVAIENIVENACEHHPTHAPVIEVDARRDGDYVELTVTDDGPGIPEQEIDVLTADSETKLEHGSGIGLWLVRWIVDHSNGTVNIESTDSGTRVTIRLLVGGKPSV
ncbi:sensor histidine kinase [Halovenus sp. HT40]|uniref:sensor histidine kinase n=1 Tax=Halovenus sp. HT40 TaxID=3126691 RepID=UPI00300F471F